MKVFMISIEHLDKKDAQSTHVLELFKNLNNLCETYLFAPKSKKSSNINCEKNIIFIPTISITIFRHIIFEILLFFYLISECRKKKPDVFYVRHSIVLYSYILASKILGIPFVVEINGLPIEQFKNNQHQQGTFMMIAIIAFTKLSEKINYKYANKIVAVTYGIKRHIESNYQINPDKIIVIQNGANTDLFRPIDKNKSTNVLNLEKDYMYIGFSGSFSRWHGLEDLVKSAPLILKKKENVKFLLVGNGVMKKQICQMVNDLNLKDNFIFIDAVPYEDVSKYLNTFDIGVILKDRSIPGSPLKLWEYMACGIPIIATNSEDFKVIEECNCGKRVDPNRQIEVANAILTLLENEKSRKEMGKNGRKFVVTHNSWKTVAKKIKKVCIETVEFNKQTSIYKDKD